MNLRCGSKAQPSRDPAEVRCGKLHSIHFEASASCSNSAKFRLQKGAGSKFVPPHQYRGFRVPTAPVYGFTLPMAL
jgi:hypothetical protein